MEDLEIEIQNIVVEPSLFQLQEHFISPQQQPSSSNRTQNIHAHIHLMNLSASAALSIISLYVKASTRSHHFSGWNLKLTFSVIIHTHKTKVIQSQKFVNGAHFLVNFFE